MKKDDWIFREKTMVNRLGRFGLIRHVTDDGVSQIEAAHDDMCMEHHRFVPGDLSIAMLMRGMAALGIKVRTAELPTHTKGVEVGSGVIMCDILRMMVPADLSDRPFMLTLPQQIEMGRELSGSAHGIMCAEHVLCLFARSAIEFHYLPLATGWIRTRNEAKKGESLVVSYLADHGGLEVGVTDPLTRRAMMGAVPDTFRVVA